MQMVYIGLWYFLDYFFPLVNVFFMEFLLYGIEFFLKWKILCLLTKIKIKTSQFEYSHMNYKCSNKLAYV